MLVSVIMPVYNSEMHIKKSIESILNQTYQNFELILIDDGSTDNSINKINSFTDNRIKLYQKNHLGISAALNYGIEKAQSNLLFRMDSDDIASKHRILTQVNFMNKNIHIDLCGSYMNIIDEKGDFLSEKIQPISHESIYSSILINSNVMHPTFCFRKEFISKLNGYRDEFIYAQDYDLLLRGLNKGFKYHNIPEFLLSYRINNNFDFIKSYNQIRLTRIAKKLYFERKNYKYENLKTLNNISILQKITKIKKRIIEAYFISNKKRIMKKFPKIFWIISCYIISLLDYELIVNMYNDTKFYFKNRYARYK